jgi:hypothetical protein
MRDALEKSHYLVVPEFISAGRAARLAESFKKLAQEQKLIFDDQAPNSPAIYNFIPFLELLTEMTPIVSELVGEPVLPTYSYARIYSHGEVLRIHKDRAACEMSITLNLSGDADWPIWFRTPDAGDVPVTLGQGQAAVYRGCDTLHWRDAFPGQEYIQVFLHYVRSRGDCAFAYFDKLKKPE